MGCGMSEELSLLVDLPPTKMIFRCVPPLTNDLGATAVTTGGFLRNAGWTVECGNVTFTFSLASGAVGAAFAG